jgi:hypothetical protein
MPWNTIVSGPLVSIAVTFGLLGMFSCPDQNQVPPTVRLSYTSGSANGTVDQTNGLPVQHVAPGQSISLTATGFSSLTGLQKIELDPSEGFTCSNGTVASSGSPNMVPAVKNASATPPPPLSLSVDMAIGPPQNWCTSLPFQSWSGSFTAVAVGQNGLQTKSQPLNFASP